MTVRARPGWTTVVTPAGDVAGPIRTRADPALLNVLAGAFRSQRPLGEERYAPLSEVAAAGMIERG